MKRDTITTTTTFQGRNNATAPRTFFLKRIADGAFYPAVGRGTLGDNHTTDAGDVMKLTERDAIARRKDLNGGGRGARYVVDCDTNTPLTAHRAKDETMATDTIPITEWPNNNGLLLSTVYNGELYKRIYIMYEDKADCYDDFREYVKREDGKIFREVKA